MNRLFVMSCTPSRWISVSMDNSYIIAKNKAGRQELSVPAARLVSLSDYSWDILNPNLHISFNVPSAVSRSYAFSTSGSSS